jgi:hypothetical protein
MYHNPILWNEENQISGKVITLKMTGDKVDHFIVEEDAFILSEENPEEFNQLSGRKIIGYILNDKIRKIEIVMFLISTLLILFDKKKIQRMAVRPEWFCVENADQKGHQFLHQVGFHLRRISASDESQRV